MRAVLLGVLMTPLLALAATPDECALLEKAGYGAGCDANTVVMPGDTRLGIADNVNAAKEYILSIAGKQAGRISNPSDPKNVYKLNNTFAVCSANFLKAYNQTFGAGSAVVVSAYRDPVVNAKAGGVPGSRHMQGLALDINPRGNGSYKTLYEFARRNPQFGVCFPHYGWDNPHLTLATGASSGSGEAAKCAAQGVIKPCSGAPKFDPNPSSYSSPLVADSGDNGTASQPLTLPGSDSASAGSPSFVPTSQYEPVSTSNNTSASWWQRLLGIEQHTTARLSCAPEFVYTGESTLIAWSCDGGAVMSRGGVSRRDAQFATMGYLSGQGYAQPTETTSYKVQCLDAERRVLDEAMCTVQVYGGATTPTPMNFRAVQSVVEWGGVTTVMWDASGAYSCEVKGGGSVQDGSIGEMETGRLFRDTTYMLTCDTPTGTESRQITVQVSPLTS